MPKIRQRRSEDRCTTAFAGISGLPEDLTDLRLNYNDPERPHVVHYTYIEGKNGKPPRYEKRVVGRVVDKRYYSIEEYRALFKRGGAPRIVPASPVLSAAEAAALRNSTTPSEPVSEVAAKESVGETNNAPAPAPAVSQQAPQPLNRRLVGSGPLFWNIAQQADFYKDLCTVFGPLRANILIALCIYQIETGSFVAKRFKQWAEAHFLPSPILLNDQAISEFLYDLGKDVVSQERFYALRRSHLKSKDVLAYDSTNISCASENNPQARKGKSKKGGVEKQVSLAMLYQERVHEIYALRVYPGNSNDSKNGLETLQQLKLTGDFSIKSVILDRGYFSKALIDQALDGGHPVLLACKKQARWVTDEIQRVAPTLNDPALSLRRTPHISGITISINPETAGAPKEKVYLHVYRDTIQWAKERADFLREISVCEEALIHKQTLTEDQEIQRNTFFKRRGKKLEGSCFERNEKSIAKYIDSLGIFSSVTTWKCTAEEAFNLYESRADVEKGFECLKTDAGVDSAISHSMFGVHGRAFLAGLCMTLIGRVRWRMSGELAEALAKEPGDEGGDLKRRLSLKEKGVSFEDILEESRCVSVYVNENGSGFLDLPDRLRNYCRALRLNKAYEEVPPYCQTSWMAKILEEEHLRNKEI